MSERHHLTIAEASQRIAARDLSPVEPARAILDRIAAADGVLHAYIAVTAERAMAEARWAEAEIMWGGGPCGPLHGVPYALKDIYDTAGLATTGHSAGCRDRVSVEDAATVRKLREDAARQAGDA